MNVIHTIIGMPNSGKTTFLAALWHLVNSGEREPALKFDRLDGDVQYLNAIVERWQHCEKAIRTSQAEDHPVVIYLEDRMSSTPVVLNFTDLSGERFESQFATRTCSAEYLKDVNGDGGLLLFVNADRPHEAVTIQDAEGLVEGASSEIEVEWKPEFVSEQAQLVDLLLCLQQPPFVAKRRRLALIVSAWDVVKNCATAEEWVRLEMPFLNQFLATNRSSFDIRVYGVSAQGGVLEGTTRDELLRRTPSDRIRCMGHATDSSDITIPLRWLTGLSDE